MKNLESYLKSYPIKLLEELLYQTYMLRFDEDEKEAIKQLKKDAKNTSDYLKYIKKK